MIISEINKLQVRLDIYIRMPKHLRDQDSHASVNMSSSGYDQNNSYNVTDHITTQRQSSVSYSKSWEGTPSILR